MIGPKKLRAIREDLVSALAATGGDPLRWLEKRMQVPERPGVAASGAGAVLHALRRFLEAPETGNRRKHRTRTK